MFAVKNRSFQPIAALLLSTTFSLLVGCNNSPTGEIVPTAPASGVVTYHGKPLENYQVLFQSDAARPAAGDTNAEGKFSLGTNRPGDGAPVGQHRVVVRYVGPPDYNPDNGSLDFVPLPPPKVKIPSKFADLEKSGLSVEIPPSGNTDIVLELP